MKKLREDIRAGWQEIAKMYSNISSVFQQADEVATELTGLLAKENPPLEDEAKIRELFSLLKELHEQIMKMRHRFAHSDTRPARQS